MGISSKELQRIFDRGHVIPEDEDTLYRLCETVYKLHFSHRYLEMDDLIQEGIIGLIRLVDEGNYSEDKGNIFTFAFSRVRNSMSKYMYHQHKEISKSVGEEPLKNIRSMGDDVSLFSHVSEELIRGISAYVDDQLMEYEVSSDLAYHVKGYFLDKLGVQYKVNSPSYYSLDFVEKYRYYVNLIEYGVFVKFINNKVFDSRIGDILDVLESEGEVGFFMKMFLDTLNEEQLRRLMYLFSSNNFQFPSKYKLLKVDNYLSIYRRLTHGNMSEVEVARMFDKPVSTIVSIKKKYDIIFS
jgi:hypothetical protein